MALLGSCEGGEVQADADASGLDTIDSTSYAAPGLSRGGVPYARWRSTSSTGFERTSKRRRGFPSEARVKRGRQVVHGEKELEEKLGRNDPCPCGSGRRFQELLHAGRKLRRGATRVLLL